MGGTLEISLGSQTFLGGLLWRGPLNCNKGLRLGASMRLDLFGWPFFRTTMDKYFVDLFLLAIEPPFRITGAFLPKVPQALGSQNAHWGPKLFHWGPKWDPKSIGTVTPMTKPILAR